MTLRSRIEILAALQTSYDALFPPIEKQVLTPDHQIVNAVPTNDSEWKEAVREALWRANTADVLAIPTHNIPTHPRGNPYTIGDLVEAFYNAQPVAA